MVAPVLRRSRRGEAGGWPPRPSPYAGHGLAGVPWVPIPAATPERGPGLLLRPGRLPGPGRASDVAGLADPGHQRSGQGPAAVGSTIPRRTSILPTGRVFDVLDVPAAAGLTALGDDAGRRGGHGPVAVGGGRTLFFVATRGAPDDEDEWWSCHLDCAPEDVGEVASLRWHCRNSYVLAPPSRDGDRAGRRWLQAPERRAGRCPMRCGCSRSWPTPATRRLGEWSRPIR